ncbi:hypothetical protein CCAX7_54910 [Capsulimonas corticalis]|uniref:Uncharacterized protein n=1 Tax=Capsulimonas corticalis TaxID=2219043 RepID=A0A402D5N8_9BACT|nr:hypothetical protein [Capsulimonas corticalis]BDI33440.1 hypothetical protein CCAX7_54910 [Capsulimonas corticalis]
MTTADVMALLRARYPKNEYAFMEQVRSSTGNSFARSADALVMSFWQSRGIHLSGIEVKTFRNDWLRELKKPEKADEIARYCDYWWVVAGDDQIVKDAELPATWGLMVVQNGKLVIKVKAPKMDPLPMSRPMLAGILRQAQNFSPATQDLYAVESAAREQGRLLGFERAEKDWKEKCSGIEEGHKQLQSSLDAFEQVSGIRIDHYNGHRIGEIVRTLSLIDGKVMRRNLTRAHEDIRAAARAMNDALTALENMAAMQPLVADQPTKIS